MQAINNNKKLYLDTIENIEYIVEFKIEENEERNESIHIIIKENDESVPYTFEGYFTLEDFIARHIGFCSCKSVQDVLSHINSLFNQNKIFINDIGLDNERVLVLKAWDISIETKSKDFILTRKMVENKDKALIDLYKGKKQLKKMLEDIVKLANERDIKDIKQLKDKIKQITSGNNY